MILPISFVIFDHTNHVCNILLSDASNDAYLVYLNTFGHIRHMEPVSIMTIQVLTRTYCQRSYVHDNLLHVLLHLVTG